MSIKKEGTLFENKILVENAVLKGWLVEKGFGESKSNKLILDLYEGVYLLTKEKIKITDGNKNLKGKDLMRIGLNLDKKFYSKLIVYSNLKEKGYTVKTGLKFGFDFRLYPKGKNMGEAHSKFGLNVYPESEKLSMTKISRITRLAGNIHINAIAAVVDREDSINYYLMERKLFK